MTAASDPTQVWADEVIPRLKGMTKALYKLGQVTGADDASITIGLPNQTHLDRCAQKRSEVETALAEAFGHPQRLSLVVGGDDVGPGPVGAGLADPTSSAATDEAPEAIDMDALVDAPTQQASGVDRVTEAFPGAQVVDP
jgi:hypothetical protein